jgi:molybdate transport system ATP-binding protein
MIEARLTLPRAGFTLHVDLRLPASGVTALFGPSGCGKTSVLRALAGLERAAGRVALGSEVWQDDATGRFVPTHQRDVGYVVQEAALFPHLSVQANLDYGLRRVVAGARRIALAHVVDLLDLGPLLPRRPATLSGGERQRVALGRALASSPRLLLLDEPLAALDSARKAELLPCLERLHAELSLPIVYVSHALDEVARLARHLVLLQAGQVLAQGPTAELLARLDLPTAQGDDAGVVLPAEVAGRDAAWHLLRLALPGVEAGLWVRDGHQPLGQGLRVRVLARDVSLALAPLAGSSISNQLPAVVEALGDDAHPGQALVRLRVGTLPLLARLTSRSVHTLGLAPGQAVWAQVKSVALLA